MPGLTLLILAVFLMWLALSAPVGRRTLVRRIVIRATPERLWSALFPLGENANWYGSYVAVERLGDDRARLSLEHPGRDGNPIVREVQFHVVVDGTRFEMTIVDDNSLAQSFWSNYRAGASVVPHPDGALVEYTETDLYRGYAFLVFRQFALRRQALKLRQWAETGAVTRGGIFEHPSTQVGFAAISAILMWPFFGLTVTGLFLSCALTLVVALHELGHMTAFRVMGHRTTRMIFIPILGGIAVGGRPYNTHFEVAFSALMGAGMSTFIASIAMYAWFAADAAGDAALARAIAVFALIAALFNLANLVPVWKFDGGQVLRQVVRRPVTQALVSFVMLGAFMGVGVLAGLPLQMMLIAGVVFAILSVMTTGSAVKPRRPLSPISAGERTAIVLGLAATFVTHACVLLWSIDRVL